MIRPVISALTSTLVCASILPLAVTIEVRSRVAMASSRTSVARPPFRAADRAVMPPTTTTSRTMNRPTFVRRDMRALSLAKWTSDRELERGDGLVVRVDGVDVARLGLGHVVLGIGD